MKEKILKLCRQYLWYFAFACGNLYLLMLVFIVFDLYLNNESFRGLLVAGIGWLLLVWRLGPKRIAAAAKLLGALCFGLSLVLCLGWLGFSRSGVYADVDQGKEALYADRRLMAIVPHQDDDLNLMSGVLEEYVKYGSEIYVVFVTNGDFVCEAGVRFQEAENVLGNMGIPADHLIFLGYGDQWAFDGPHLYNAPSGQVMTSVAGKTQTYGAEFHPAYREGRDYTIENIREDLESVILEYRPELIFCSDYDPHIDHKSTSLLFDRVMGKILKEVPDYRPVVYKGFTYAIAWLAGEDYYAENMLSGGRFSLSGTTYRWEDGVRFSVQAGTLSRSLISAPAYKSLKGYVSQGAYLYGQRIINGDRLFWRRETESLCLTAKIEASSGEMDLLNDFMRLENSDLKDAARSPWDGVWIPGTDDQEKTVKVTFAEPSSVDRIVLYDHPSPEQNVVEVEICFDDGSCIFSGPLDPEGAATAAVVGKEQVTSFEIHVASAEGEQAGLTEIEAFADPCKPEEKILKLMNEQENFVYDYWIDEAGTESLCLYTYGLSSDISTETLSVDVSNKACSAVWTDGALLVDCPAGEEMLLTVSLEEEGVSDTVRIHNPGKLMRGFGRFFQRTEKRMLGITWGVRFGMWEWEPSAQWLMEKIHMLTYYAAKYLL